MFLASCLSSAIRWKQTYLFSVPGTSSVLWIMAVTAAGGKIHTRRCSWRLIHWPQDRLEGSSIFRPGDTGSPRPSSSETTFICIRRRALSWKSLPESMSTHRKLLIVGVMPTAGTREGSKICPRAFDSRRFCWKSRQKGINCTNASR